MTTRILHTCLTPSGVLLGLVLLGMASAANAQKYYKWVDDNGVVRYTDTMPQKSLSKKRQTMNKHGVVVGTREAARSAEENAAFQKAARESETNVLNEKKDREAQRKKDQALLLTFSSEAELIQAKEERIEVLNSIILLIYKGMAGTTEKLNRLENLADQQYTSKGLPVPGGLAQNIEVLSRKNFNRVKQLRQKLAEKIRIESRYELDRARYRNLINQ